MAKRSKAWGTQRIHEFIKSHSHEHDVQTMCRALEVTRSGYYLMRANKIRALHAYRTRHYSSGKPSVRIPNLVQDRQRGSHLESDNRSAT